MKYSARQLRWNGEYWTCYLQWWTNCECNKQEKMVEIHQVKRPSMDDIKNAYFNSY